MSHQLTESQRYAIYVELEAKKRKKSNISLSSIARLIGVSPSTVCREVKRNCNAKGDYVFLIAQHKADSRRHGLEGNHRKPPGLWREVERLIMEQDWSPAQIAGVLRQRGVHICKQTIYNHVHADRTGRLAKRLPHQLKYTRRMKKLRPTKATNIPNRTSIHERPKEADGTRFGDWEMDTILDGYGHAILTLTERSTNFIIMERLPHGKRAYETALAVIRLLYPYRKLVKTITTDNGSEFAAHQLITKKLTPKGMDDIIVYFADSYSSWQKGAIENANKLIRRYIPKKSNFNDFTDKFIMSVQKKLNKRPREKLNFSNPITEFFKHFH